MQANFLAYVYSSSISDNLSVYCVHVSLFRFGRCATVERNVNATLRDTKSSIHLETLSRNSIRFGKCQTYKNINAHTHTPNVQSTQTQ